MADTTIGGMPAAGAVADTDLFEVEQGVFPANTSGKRTWLEIRTALTTLFSTMFALDRSTVTALSIAAGVVNINCALGDFFTLSLTANVTSITFSNLPAAGKGASISVRIRQDGTGGRTVALPTSFKATGGSDTSVQSAANAYTLLIITSFDQGTRWEYAMQEIAA